MVQSNEGLLAIALDHHGLTNLTKGEGLEGINLEQTAQKSESYYTIKDTSLDNVNM